MVIRVLAPPYFKHGKVTHSSHMLFSDIEPHFSERSQHLFVRIIKPFFSRWATGNPVSYTHLTLPTIYSV